MLKHHIFVRNVYIDEDLTMDWKRNGFNANTCTSHQYLYAMCDWLISKILFLWSHYMVCSDFLLHHNKQFTLWYVQFSHILTSVYAGEPMKYLKIYSMSHKIRSEGKVLWYLTELPCFNPGWLCLLKQDLVLSLRVSCSLPLVTTRSLATPVAGPDKIDRCGKRPHR